MVLNQLDIDAKLQIQLDDINCVRPQYWSTQALVGVVTKINFISALFIFKEKLDVCPSVPTCTKVHCERGSQSARLADDIKTCHSRKSTGVYNIIYNGSM